MGNKNKIAPVHPGEILLEEFLQPMGISQYKLAADLNIPLQRINQVCIGKRGITAQTALLLSKYFGLSENFWLNLQNRFDLELAKDSLKDKIDKIKSIN
jgi:addiction module HigA family antidote